MQTYQGAAHMPGADTDWIIAIELDWGNKAASVNVEGQPGRISTWQGLALQTFGDYEISFRTKGIPPLLTHWWHLVRTDADRLSGIIIAVPDRMGDWLTCPIQLKRVKK